MHKDEVPGLCTCDNTRSGPRKTQSNTCLRHQNASEHAYLGSCANVDHVRVQGKHHIAPQWYSAVGLGSTSRTRQTHASKRIRPWTHARTACERRKRVVKGCVCRGVVDGPTRAARGTRMVLHMDLCDTCVCTCVYVCFKRTLHVMAWRLLRHGSERIHRSCRSRVASDLSHEHSSFPRTRRCGARLHAFT